LRFFLMVLAPFVNYNMDAIFPFCAEAAQSEKPKRKKAKNAPNVMTLTNLDAIGFDVMLSISIVLIKK